LPLLTFLGLPAGASAALYFGASLGSPANGAAGLLAGVGVLGGLLFQVIAWVSSRLGSLADATSSSRPTQSEAQVLRKLDAARANLAYASALSIVSVVELAVVVMLKTPPQWLHLVSGFLLFHFGATLVICLIRINEIGRSDRVRVLTRSSEASPLVSRPDDRSQGAA
jgi:hypothetical protein